MTKQHVTSIVLKINKQFGLECFYLKCRSFKSLRMELNYLCVSQLYIYIQFLCVSLHYKKFGRCFVRIEDFEGRLHAQERTTQSLIERAYKVRNAWRHESNKCIQGCRLSCRSKKTSSTTWTSLTQHGRKRSAIESCSRNTFARSPTSFANSTETLRYFHFPISRAIFTKCTAVQDIFCSLNSFSRQGSWEWDQTEGQRHWWNAEQCESSRNESRGRTDRLARSSCSRGRFYI